MLPPKPTYSIATDVGGTWTRVNLYQDQTCIRKNRAAAMPVSALPNHLATLIRKWRVRPTHIHLASRGIWTREDRSRLAAPLQKLAQHVNVLSDVEAAWLAAFHNSPCGGILVISGTGSIAYARDARGKQKREGGLGPLLGDEGSGFWIGKEWLKRTHQEKSLSRLLKILHQSDNLVSRIAAFTPTVLQKAERHHQVAEKIRSEAQDHLIQLIQTLTQTCKWTHEIPVAFSGSVACDPLFQKDLLKKLKRLSPRIQLYEALTDPMTAMVHHLA